MVGNEPDSHTEQHPCLVLLVPLHRTASPQNVDEVGLNNLHRLVALFRNTERQFAREIGELCVQLGAFRIESGCNSANCWSVD